MVIAALLLLPPFASAAECTDTWTGGAEGSWASSGSWSEGHVPGATDVACVGSGKRVTIFEGPNQVAAVQGGGTLVLASSTFELTGGTSNIGEFVEGGGGILTGPGTLETASLLWGEGKMTGSGATVVTGTGTIGNLGSEPQLWGRTFVNEGATTMVPFTRLWEFEGAEFDNQGTFTLNSQYEPGIADGGGSPSFVNGGILAKTAGAWVGHIQVNVQNYGTVEVASGSLEFGGGGTAHSGTWDAAEPGAIELDHGTFLLKGGALSDSVTVGGSAVFEGITASSLHLKLLSAGSITVAEDLSVASFEGSGTLNGPGTFETSSLLWRGGTMSGSGSTVVSKGGTGTINAEINEPVLSGRTFVNEGTTTLEPTSRMHETGTAELSNLGKFVLNSQYEPAIAKGGGSESSFINIGTLTKTEGSGVGQIAPATINFGKIHPETGEIELLDPIKVTGSTATPGQACSVAADPVQCATGNFTETQADFAVGGRGVGLDLTRTYSAQAAAAGVGGIFGHGWANSFGDHLIPGAASEKGGYYYEPLFREAGGGPVTLVESSGASVPFSKSGGTYSAPGWSQDELTGSISTGFTLTLPDQTVEKFSAEGQLESVTDHNGNETILGYDGSGNLETITDPSGRTITLTYNGEALVESAEDPMGHVVHYTYESGNLKTVRLPGESSPNWTFGYDGSHRMTSMKDGRGAETTNEYDGSSRVIAQTEPEKRKTTFAYGSFETTITNQATGAVTHETFNSNNQPMTITRGVGTAVATSESFTYTGLGFLASRTDGNGHTTTFGYDSEGNRTSERDAEGDETKWTFNGAHQMLTTTTPSGEKTTIVRDLNGNPETISRPAPESKTQTVEFSYGPHGEIEKMTNPLGATWSYEYDNQGDRTAATDSEGDKRTWAYDEDSQLASTVSPRGNEEGAEASKFKTIIERDAQGRPEEFIEPLGDTTEYAYDADGNVESVTDQNGHKTEFTYNADNEPTKVEHASGVVEETGYDGAGQVTSQTDGNNDKTTYVRNVLEQPVETIDPLERKTTRTFDAAGNLQTLKDPDGRTTTYGYDKANRLTGISFSDGITPDVTLAYDEDGNLISMVDGTGASTYEYDQLDRLNHSEDGNGETVGWEYNLGDEQVGLTYPNGKSISREYDEAGRLESVTDWLGHTTTFDYDADSAPTRTTFPVGTTDADEYAYDRADRMSAVTMKKGSETLASLAYTRDPAGQIESLTSGGLPGAEAESFSYDEDERLTKAGAAEYGYDAADNPTEAPGTVNAFDEASQLESATGATFTYDDEGERTKRSPSSGPPTTYKYDQAGNLTAIERAEEGETPAIAESFDYNGSGLLTSRTIGAGTRHLVWDLGESPEQLLSDGEDSYVYGPGGLVFEQISSGEVPTYLHHDQLGSTRLLTNSSGASVGTFTYAPFGALSGRTGSTSTALGYAGQYTLGQSGLQYLRARFYDPLTAQFLTVDPAVGATREPFTYGGSNPLTFKDPSGLSFAEDYPGVGIPCLYCKAVQGVEELTEPAWNSGVNAGGWLLRNSLGITRLGETADEAGEAEEAREADSPADAEVPCARDTVARRGSPSQEMTKAENFLRQVDIGRGINPQSPSGGAKATKIAALIAEILHHIAR